MNWQQSYKWKPFTLLVSAEEVKGNEMTKFNVGDRVEYVGSKIGYCVNDRIGKTGNVTYTDDPYTVSIETDCGDFFPGVYRHNLKLIEKPSPIRTVTRREPVQGNYGIVAITKNNKIMIAAGDHSSEELEEAAHILSQLAEVKKENGE